MSKLNRTHTSHPVPFEVEGEERTAALWIPDNAIDELSDEIIRHLVQETAKTLAEAGAKDGIQMILKVEDYPLFRRLSVEPIPGLMERITALFRWRNPIDLHGSIVVLLQSTEVLQGSMHSAIAEAYRAGHMAGTLSTFRFVNELMSLRAHAFPTPQQVVAAYMTDNWTDSRMNLGLAALSMLNGSPIPDAISDVDRQFARTVVDEFSEEGKADCLCKNPFCQVKLAYATLALWDFQRVNFEDDDTQPDFLDWEDDPDSAETQEVDN